MADACSALLREFFAQRRQQHRQRRAVGVAEPAVTMPAIPVGETRELHAGAHADAEAGFPVDPNEPA